MDSHKYLCGLGRCGRRREGGSTTMHLERPGKCRVGVLKLFIKNCTGILFALRHRGRSMADAVQCVMQQNMHTIESSHQTGWF